MEDMTVCGMIVYLPVCILPAIGFPLTAVMSVQRFDVEEQICIGRAQWIWILFIGAINSLLILFIVSHNPGGIWELLWECFLLGIIEGCLLFACITDLCICKVYDFVWWAALTAGTVLLVLRYSADWETLAETAAFFLLQELFFNRFYGRADCHAFCACALVENAFSMGMREYLLHMTLAFLLLTVIQFFRKNIGKDGNLKKMAPFLPYITISFWLLLIIHNL